MDRLVGAPEALEFVRRLALRPAGGGLRRRVRQRQLGLPYRGRTGRGRRETYRRPRPDLCQAAGDGTSAAVGRRTAARPPGRRPPTPTASAAARRPSRSRCRGRRSSRIQVASSQPVARGRRPRRSSAMPRTVEPTRLMRTAGSATKRNASSIQGVQYSPNDRRDGQRVAGKGDPPAPALEARPASGCGGRRPRRPWRRGRAAPRACRRSGRRCPRCPSRAASGTCRPRAPPTSAPAGCRDHPSRRWWRSGRARAAARARCRRTRRGRRAGPAAGSAGMSAWEPPTSRAPVASPTRGTLGTASALVVGPRIGSFSTLGWTHECARPALRCRRDGVAAHGPAGRGAARGGRRRGDGRGAVGAASGAPRPPWPSSGSPARCSSSAAAGRSRWAPWPVSPRCCRSSARAWPT